MGMPQGAKSVAYVIARLAKVLTALLFVSSIVDMRLMLTVNQLRVKPLARVLLGAQCACPRKVRSQEVNLPLEILVW